ncbi:uncharacterized oxidoreductase YjmC-like [Periplaneta americana]|uniref:uncharacterized oxidoreductase YjmC-like n=1 Tax=Periplaneta americana TaxID=6978 RepID=UPI0037E87204
MFHEPHIVRYVISCKHPDTETCRSDFDCGVEQIKRTCDKVPHNRDECQDSSSHSLKMALRSVAARVARSVRSTLEADGSEALLRTVSSMAASRGVVPVQEAKRFMVDAMTAVGTLHDHAEQLADVLVAADYKGHFSHGLNRLDMYVADIEHKTTEPNAKPSLLKESPATAWVDGNNGLGPVVGNFCMDLAIKKAKNVGVGWVVAKRSNHYGIAGWYSRTALDRGLLGMSFTNTSPLMSPTRAKQSALGTNPLSLAAPGKNGDSFVLDMATTAVAVGKIEVQRRKGEPIAEGWAQDPEGRITTDADLAFKTSCLMPLGGAEITSGYKGYGLGLLVETFCGILAGATFGPNIRRWMENTDRPADLGQCFVAIDPQCFAPGFEDRMSELMDYLRGMQPSEQSKPVLVPGDPERNHMKMVDEEGGIRYHENQLKASAALATQLSITPMQLK